MLIPLLLSRVCVFYSHTHTLYSLPHSPLKQGGASLCNWHTSVSPPAFFHTAVSLASHTVHSPHTGFWLVGHTSSSISNVVLIKFDPDSVLSFSFFFFLPICPGSVWPTQTYSTCGCEDICTGLSPACAWLLVEECDMWDTGSGSTVQICTLQSWCCCSCRSDEFSQRSKSCDGLASNKLMACHVRFNLFLPAIRNATRVWLQQKPHTDRHTHPLTSPSEAVHILIRAAIASTAREEEKDLEETQNMNESRKEVLLGSGMQKRRAVNEGIRRAGTCWGKNSRSSECELMNAERVKKTNLWCCCCVFISVTSVTFQPASIFFSFLFLSCVCVCV